MNLMIGDIEVKGLIRGSIRITKRNDFSSEASFSIITDNSNTIVGGQDVNIWFEDKKIFGGVIREIQYTIFDFSRKKYIATIYATDYKVICSRRTVSMYYINTTAGSIVSDLIDKYLSEEGITAGTINAGITVQFLNEPAISIYDALDKLADESSYIWYIDDNKALHFIPPSFPSVTTYNLSDMKFKEIRITSSIQDYRNKQFVTYIENGTVKVVVAENDVEINNRKAIEGGSGVYGSVFMADTISNDADALMLAQNLLNQYGQINNEFVITAKGIYGLGNLVVDGDFAGTYEITQVTIFDDTFSTIWTELQCTRRSDAIKTFARAFKQNQKLTVGGYVQAYNNFKNSSFERYTTTNKPLYWDTDGFVTSLADGLSNIGVVLGSFQKIENNSSNRPPSSKFDNKIIVLSFFHKGGSVQVQVFNQDTWAPMKLTNGLTYINFSAKNKWTQEIIGINLEQTSGIWVRITNIDTTNAYIDNIMLGNSSNYVDGPESAPWDNTATPYMVNEYNIQTQATVNLTFDVPYTAPPYVGIATSTAYSYTLIQDSNGYYTGVQITFKTSGIPANVFVIGRL